MNFKTIGLLAIIASTVMFSSCNKEKLAQLQSQNQILAAEKARQDSILNDVLGTFNQFEDNLAEIKQRENLVSAAASGDAELGEGGKEQILQDIQLINQLLADNRQIISNLTTQLESSEGQSSQLRSAVSRLKRQLEERDAQVNELKGELASLNMAIEDLNGRVDTLSQVNTRLATLREVQSSQIQEQETKLETQSQKIAAQTQALNSAYYVASSLRDLKQNGITDGRRLATDFNTNDFTKIDMTEVSSIPLGVKKARLLTTHPTDSYTLVEVDGEIASLQITDARRFWQATKYLVIELN
ncbi:MAG: hypothetical protein NWR72_14645 [Bacteroidia bacterium]|nr:hypothetical protein [Bacteroidia bacterium]